MKSKAVKTKPLKVKSEKTSANGDGRAVEVRSRVQRKQSKQLHFLSKLQNGRDNLPARKTIAKKKRKRTRDKVAKVLGSLSSLADSLPTNEEIAASAKTSKRKVSRSTSRQQVVVNETKQLAAVLAHAEFQRNPLLAIQQHLINTLPSGDLPTQDRKQGQKKDKKRKKQSKKGSTVRPMVE